jgi:hypothetical protein
MKPTTGGYVFDDIRIQETPETEEEELEFSESK